MGVLGTENDELSRPDPDEKLRPVCKKPNVFFRIERPPGNTALPTLPPTHRFDFAGDQYLYVDIFIVHLQRSLLFPFELPFCHFHKNFSSFDLVPPRLKSIQIGRCEVFQRPLQPGIGPAIKAQFLNESKIITTTIF